MSPSVRACSRSVSRCRAESKASAAIVAKRSTVAISAAPNSLPTPIRYTLSAATTRSPTSSGTETSDSGSFSVPSTTSASGSMSARSTLRVRRFVTTQPVTPSVTGKESAMTSSAYAPSAKTGTSIVSCTSYTEISSKSTRPARWWAIRVSVSDSESAARIPAAASTSASRAELSAR